LSSLLKPRRRDKNNHTLVYDNNIYTKEVQKQNSNGIKIMWLKLFLVAFFCTFQFINALDTSLETVFVIYRHGDRTPVSPYPTDPWKDRSNWPVGFGQLTPRGKMMQYNLGKYLRNRYGNLLSEQYDEKAIYVSFD